MSEFLPLRHILNAKNAPILLKDIKMNLFKGSISTAKCKANPRKTSQPHNGTILKF